MKHYLLEREAALSKAIDQITEQHNWAMHYQHFDLAHAYTEGERHLLALMAETQKTIQALGGH